MKRQTDSLHSSPLPFLLFNCPRLLHSPLSFHSTRWFHPCCPRWPPAIFQSKLLKDTDHFKMHDTRAFYFMGLVAGFTMFFMRKSLHVLEVNILNACERVSMHLSNLIRC